MNKGIFRLVFDASRAMQVPAPECSRGRGKQNARGRSRRLAVAAATLLALSAHAARPLPSSATLAPRFNLPQAATNFNQLGRATQAINAANARRLVVDQVDKRVILNWSSFDIGAGYAVRFNQPAGGSALNRIGGSDPSVILGTIEANAEVILYNANGMLFGRNATVNTGNFIATTLNIADEQFEKGFRNITSYTPAFQAADGEIEGFIRVEAGASIAAANGGDILMFAPRVLNEGRLSAPGGQVVLAAGQKVYLAASLDPSARGLLVEVDPFVTAEKDYNTVENAPRGSTPVTLDSGELVQRVNEIVTERGSISLVGLAVKQTGTARATTTVKGQNGAIYLLAHGNTTSVAHTNGITGNRMAAAAELGEVVVGPQSVTRVDPDAGPASQVDAEPFYNSIVRLEGKQVHLQGGAQIVAPGAGSLTPAADAAYRETKRGVSILASETPLASGVFGTSTGASDNSRIVIDPGVLVDVSGATVDLSMASNVLTGRLFSIQLADSPLQRAGVLYRKEISFDRRKGIKVANVNDFYGQIQRTAAEKLSAGGSIAIKSDGAVVVGQGSTLDVSGGKLNFAAGEIKTTQLRQGNRLIDIADARADVIYDEVVTPATGRYEAAYVEGRNAGEIVVAGRQVVLDGTLAGSVVTGRYQRGGTAGVLPAAGRLQVGIAAGPAGAADYYVNKLLLRQAGATPLAAGFFADPFTNGLGTRADVTTISAQAIEAGGFGRVVMLATEALDVAAGTTLNLGAGGSFTASSNRIEVGGSVSATGGDIALNAVPTIVSGATPAPDADVSVAILSGARLSTAGSWTSDGRNTAGSEAPVAPGGGSIKLAAYDSVRLAADASLDVSAGAWRSAAGKLSYGKAGAIEIGANAGNSVALRQTGTVRLDGTVTGYGFTGGGSFKLTTLDLTMGDTAGPGLLIKPSFFSDNGFENITLNSLGDLNIVDNTTIGARLRNRALNLDAAGNPSGTAIASISHFASPTEVDDVARKAVNLSFAATRLPSASEGTAGASLTVGSGAAVATEAGGSLSFSAGRNLTVAGTLEAPGGNVTLTVEGTRGGSESDPDKIGFLPTQAIWLTDSAKILAGGTVEYKNARNGLRSGTVYAGGSVTLNAKHGYVIGEADSTISIDGYETTLDLYGGSVRSLVSRDAGSLTLSSPEGIFLDSTVSAAAPSARASGGSLNVSISRKGSANFTEGAAYSTAERKIVVRNGGSILPAGLNPGDDINAAVGNGVAAVSARAIGDTGFAAVQLRADDRIEFAQSTTLSATRSLELNTRVIAGQGSTAVSLSAPYIALGDIDILQVPDMVAPAATTGTASLAVTADLMDVVGTFGLQGFATADLSATRGGRRDGEIRLRGHTPPGGTTQTGSLLFAGQLDLRAGQIYPTTFTRFDITGLTGDSTLRTHAPAGGSTAALPLSAFGELRLEADSIEHGGTVRAPFGKLELNATDRLTLSADSEVSVSGAGLTVPVGTTVNGTTWYYYPQGTTNADVVRTIAELPVAKSVVLKSATLDVSPAALVSAAGGGDAQASEFIPGAGGSKDYLAGTKGLYAVLPDYAFGYAPQDAQISAGSDLKPGEQIVITMAGSGLAPGRYTLLPAAYALLPGAVLVSKAADQGTTVLGSALALSDGSNVVTGYRSVAGTAVAGDDHERYVVQPAATFRARAEYRLTSGSDIFSGLADRQGTDAGRLPKDAGRISMAASTQLLDWKALFDLSAPAGARAGEFDLAVPNVVLVESGQAPSVGHTAADGYTVVSTESLAATGAASTLLGGTRSGAGAAVTVDSISDRVRVESNVQASELLLAAKKSITVAGDTVIAATGAAENLPGQLNLSGDGAFLRVSNREGVDIVRTGASRSPGFGDLTVGAGARFSGSQVDVDATGNMSLDSTAMLSAASFGLGAGRISFGGASPEGDSVAIGGTLLTTMREASSLSLRSYSTIDFLDSLDLALTGTGRLLLDAPGLRGLGGAGDTVSLGASEVLLRNSSGNTLTASGQGELNIEAHPPLRDGTTGGMEVGAGNQSLGFDRVTLSSKGDLTFSGTGQVKIQGDLDLVAQRVTGATGTDQGVVAGGVLTVSRPAEGHTLGELAGLGAKLALASERVVQNGSIDLPGGRLTIAAANAAGAAYGIEIGAGSVTRAGGFSVTTGDGWTNFGDAGSITATAAQGAIQVDGIVGVGALTGGGNAGVLSFAASGNLGTLELGSGATLEGAGGSGGKGGSFVADLKSLPDPVGGSMDGLAEATANFSHSFGLRVRSGKVELAVAEVKARSVTIAADAGDLSIGGSIDASGGTGGRIDLHANRDAGVGGHLTLAAGSVLKANATEIEGSGNTGRGGSVSIGVGATTTADESGTGIDFSAAADGKAAARIDVSTAAGSTAPQGSVSFRAPRQDTEQALQTLGGAAINPGSSVLTVLTGAGSATAYSIATAMNSYQPGMVALFTAPVNSTGALTLNVNGKGAKALVQADGSAFSSSARISSGQVVAAVYDGTRFVVSSIGLTDTGSSGSAYKVAFATKPAALTSGMLVSFKAKNANPAGAVTLAVNADVNLTRNLVDENGATLAANAIAAGQLVTAVYDGSQFRVIRDTSLALTPNIIASSLAGTLTLDGEIVGAAASSLEAVRSIGKTYDVGINAERQRAYLAQTRTAAALFGATPAGLSSKPGLQVLSERDITVTDDWNLGSARYNGQAGYLTLRAQGNLNVNATISDGFNGVARNSTIQSGEAWSLRLAAGADLAAANPLTINAAGTGDLSVAGGKLLRTTSGSIELAAGRDIVLGGTAAAPATVMVTGTPSALDPALAAEFTTPANAVFTSRGGHLAALAGRDIKSPVSDQTLVNNWFQRSGRLSNGQFSTNSMAWWSRFDLFRHGLGSFGGGNVSVAAGRDIQDVSVVAPTSARMGSFVPDVSKLVVENGGDVDVTAGRNIAGGSFFVGRGEGSLKADGSIVAGTQLNATIGQLAPVFALMDGDWTVRANGDAAITAVFNPTIVVPNRNNTGSSFYSYGTEAGLDVATMAGNFSWTNMSNAALTSLAALPAGTTEDLSSFVAVTYSALYVAPQKVRLAAFDGDVRIEGNSTSNAGISLYPSAAGNLELYAGRDMALNTSVRVMDNLPGSLASVTAPTFTATNLLFLGLAGATIGYEINKLIFTDLHAGDSNPLRIHAQGSLAVVDGRRLISPKLSEITAGLDITNLTLYGQHHNANDETLISAGRNFVNNSILGTNGLISLAGPGLLEINAGRQLNLGASAGVETIGNIYNATLPASGASVRLGAGLDAALDADGFDRFTATYLAAAGAPSGASYRNSLVDYVTQSLKPGTGVTYSYDEALGLFGGFSSAGRIAFVKSVLAEESGRSYLAPGKPYATVWTQAATDAGVSPDVFSGTTFERLRDKVMFEEIQLGGIAGSSAKDAAAKDAGYAQGYTAIDLAGYGAPFRFVGDIDLIQSKVQTKSGGDIEFRAPGGGVNVGLSADVSSAIGGTKTSDKRGVVAFAGGNIRSFSDGDFLVNAQKVFVIGAGDILLWSSNANIDSGKGSNNTVTVPPLVPKIDPTDGSIIFELPTLATGSGIGILDASDGKASGAAYLFAPRGEVVALDAFIRAPTIFVDPDRIKGGDNLQGQQPNAPSTPAVASVSGLGSVASNPTEATSATNAAPKAGEQEKNSILTVEVLALGDGGPAPAGGESAGGNKESDEKRKKKPEES